MIEYAVIIQARMGSTRRPGKIAYEVLGKALLYHQVEHLRECCQVPIIIATSEEVADDWTASFCDDINIPCFRGSEKDVMHRYLMAAKYFNIKNIVRVGGDDPLIDPECINSLIYKHKVEKEDFLYASHRNGWIYGTAAELITTDALKRAYDSVDNDVDKEHVVSYIRKSELFNKQKIFPKNKKLVRPDIFLSVDYQEDIDLVSQIFRELELADKLYTFSQGDIVKLYDSGVLKINNHHLHESFDEE
jgi:spore coat polysaccharide biosynthesis protein SpsF